MRPATDSLPPILGSWARALIDVFYPRNCILTGEPLADSRYRYLSDVAVRRLPRIHDPRCPTCGHPYYGDIETAPACHHCENLQPAFKTGRCGYLFKRDIRIILHSLKYRKRTYLARDIALLLADAPGFLDFLSGAVLVPVPLHPTKLRKRGFNQTAEILRHLKGYSPTPLTINPLLHRQINTESQTRASRSERLKRVRGAFGISETAVLPPLDTRCIVFDDVFTTGATLNTCSHALLTAGFKNIDVAAFAHG